MSIDLDPQEVLEHLYSLGYYNITKEQLQDFIKDLKKLIKYDLRRKQKRYPFDLHLDRPNKENASNSLPTSPSKKQTLCHHISTCKTSPRMRLNSASDSPTKDTLSPKITATCQQTNKHSSSTCPHCNHPLVCKDVCPEAKETALTSEEFQHEKRSNSIKKPPESTTSSKKQHSVKPCPSFIRPSSGKGKPPKADPVALYHYYKSLWSQQPLPGESSHEDLRWRIRHKMMAAPECTCNCKFTEENNFDEIRRLHKLKQSIKDRKKPLTSVCKKRCNNCEFNYLKWLKSLEDTSKPHKEEKFNKKPDWVAS